MADEPDKLPNPARGRAAPFDWTEAPCPSPPATRPGGSRDGDKAKVDARVVASRLAEVREQLIAKNWRDVDLLVRAAGMCRELGQVEEARGMLSRALSLDRNNTYARAMLAELCTPDQIREMGLPAPSQSLSRDPWEPFHYAVRGNGPVMIGMGAVCFGAAYLVVGLFTTAGGVAGYAAGLVVSLLILIYLLAYLRSIVRSTATDAKEAPDWPDYDDGLVLNGLKMVVILALPMVPALVWGAVTAESKFSPWLARPVHLALILPGMCVLPMMMLLYCVSGRLLAALDPRQVFGSIRRVGRDYWLAAGIWAAAELLRNLLDALFGAIPLVGTIVSMAACLYCMLVGGRAVGLVYQARHEQLGWFNR